MSSKPRSDNDPQWDQDGTQALASPEETESGAFGPDDGGDKAPRSGLPSSFPGAIKLLIIFGLSGALWFVIIALLLSLLG